jgi:hypothetical protein
MQDTKDSSSYCTGNNAVCDALRYLGDASYAVLPEDVAHRLGEFKKNLLGSVCWLVEKQIEWIDARVAGGDRLREEWQRAAHGRSKTETTGSGI